MLLDGPANQEDKGNGRKCEDDCEDNAFERWLIDDQRGCTQQVQQRDWDVNHQPFPPLHALYFSRVLLQRQHGSNAEQII